MPMGRDHVAGIQILKGSRQMLRATQIVMRKRGMMMALGMTHVRTHQKGPKADLQVSLRPSHATTLAKAYAL